MTNKSDKHRPNLFNPLHFLALGLGSGMFPKAPGTMGTLMAWLLWWPLSQMSQLFYSGFLIVFIFFGIYLCGKTARDLNTHDAPSIVWDEFCGYWLTMLFSPVSFWWSVYGFALFRFFDIVKPWPIKWADRYVGGGTGIMLDDLIAGIFAMVVLEITFYFVV